MTRPHERTPTATRAVAGARGARRGRGVVQDGIRIAVPPGTQASACETGRAGKRRARYRQADRPHLGPLVRVLPRRWLRVHAHGFLDGPSEDVDLFTTAETENYFPDAVTAVIGALDAHGLDIVRSIDNPGFARLQVTDPTTGDTAKIELGVDWRAHPPVTLTIGPVLHPDDAVANKICALYSHAQARDYIDVDAILHFGRYTGDQLLALATDHDPGFDTAMFVVALRAIARLPEAEFTAYGIADAEVLTARILAWADTLHS